MGKMVTSVCWLPFLFAPKFKFPYVQTCKVTSIYIVKWPSALNAWILGIILTYLSQFKNCICSYTSCITKAQSDAHKAGLCLNLEFRSKPDANTVYRRYVRRYIGIRLESPRTTYRGQKPECMPSGVFNQAGYSKGSIYAISERENKVALFSNS